MANSTDEAFLNAATELCFKDENLLNSYRASKKREGKITLVVGVAFLIALLLGLVAIYFLGGDSADSIIMPFCFGALAVFFGLMILIRSFFFRGQRGLFEQNILLFTPCELDEARGALLNAIKKTRFINNLVSVGAVVIFIALWLVSVYALGGINFDNMEISDILILLAMLAEAVIAIVITTRNNKRLRALADRVTLLAQNAKTEQ